MRAIPPRLSLTYYNFDRSSSLDNKFNQASVRLSFEAVKDQFN